MSFHKDPYGAQLNKVENAKNAARNTYTILIYFAN